MPAGKADIHIVLTSIRSSREIVKGTHLYRRHTVASAAVRYTKGETGVLQRTVVRIQDAQLKRFVIDSGLVPRGELAAAEEVLGDGTTLADVLLARGAMTEDDLRRVESYVLGIPFVSLKDRKIDVEVLSLIPEPVARTHNVVAFKRGEDALEVAVLDVEDLEAIDFVKASLGLKVLPRLTDTASMKAALRQYQKTLKDAFGEIIRKETAQLSAERGGDVPVTRIIDTLLRHAIVQGASDIHVEPMETEVLVRYRIDGILRDAMSLPTETAVPLAARIKTLASLKLEETHLPQDGRFKMEVDGQTVSFRVSTLPVYCGEKVVMRLVRAGRGNFTLEGLGFHGEGLERTYRATRKDAGTILIAGPAGAGKTTTLYTLLDLMNTPEVNISTVEDPIEYQIPRINQTQVRPETAYTFATGLRSLMRQDPDILMVGGIEDEETAELATRAALTGHLVLAGVPADSASASVTYLLERGVEPFLLVSTLSVVVGQRLVRRLAEGGESYTLSASERADLAQYADLDRVLAVLKEEKKVREHATWNDISFVRTDERTEYRGQIGLHEVLSISPAIQEIVMRGGSTEDIDIQARTEGMLSLAEDGIYKAALGVTSIDEVLRVLRG